MIYSLYLLILAIPAQAEYGSCIQQYNTLIKEEYIVQSEIFTGQLLQGKLSS